MIEHFRNFGAMTTAREFWGGNNGFLTIAVQFDESDVGGVSPVYELPVGTDYVAAKGRIDAHDGGAYPTGESQSADLTRVMNAERNLFNLAQAAGQRAVIVAVSELEMDDATVATAFNGYADIEAWETASTVTGNTLAFGSSGTTATDIDATHPVYVVTFLIERADVLTAQTNKPGATYAVNVDPAEEVAQNIMAVQFSSSTATYEPNGALTAGLRNTPEAVGVKVIDALPVQY